MRGKGPPLLAHGAPVVTGRPGGETSLPLMLSSLRRLHTRSLTVPSPPSDARPYARSSVPADHARPFLRALSPCLLPTARESSGLARIFSCRPTLPPHRGTLETRASCRATAPAHLPEKSALGGGWGPGGRRASCAPAKGPSFPRNRRHPPSCPHLRKQQRIFIIMCWPGDRMAHSHAPRPGAEKARHDAKERVPPLSRLRARKTGERCPRACPGPFFTISPLQPSSRGYYELYQGRCLEISCGAPPR